MVVIASASVLSLGRTPTLLLEREAQVAALRALIEAAPGGGGRSNVSPWSRWAAARTGTRSIGRRHRPSAARTTPARPGASSLAAAASDPRKGRLRVRLRVQACLRLLQIAADCCSVRCSWLQALSVPRGYLAALLI